MTKNELTSIFDSFKEKHILIIGDVMIDSYLWGDVTRISPEAPVPIIATTSRENRLGGAANVALNIQALGATPILCSVIGDDDAGNIFQQLLENNNMPTDGMVTSKQRKTTIKTRIISHHQHLLRVDEEEDHPIETALQTKLNNHIQHILNQYKIDAIIFEDYDKGAITPEIIKFTSELANQKAIPTLVDPKKRNFDNYQSLTFFKPNFKEFKEGVKVDVKLGDESAILKAAQSYRKKQKLDIMMVTMAEKGVMVIDDEGHSFIPAEKREIADVSGAGDTVISVSALCLASGLSSEYVARIANMAGGLVCEHSGVVPIDKAELLNECFLKIISQ